MFHFNFIVRIILNHSTEPILERRFFILPVFLLGSERIKHSRIKPRNNPEIIYMTYDMKRFLCVFFSSGTILDLNFTVEAVMKKQMRYSKQGETFLWIKNIRSRTKNKLVFMEKDVFVYTVDIIWYDLISLPTHM